MVPGSDPDLYQVYLVLENFNTKLKGGLSHVVGPGMTCPDEQRLHSTLQGMLKSLVEDPTVIRYPLLADSWGMLRAGTASHMNRVVVQQGLLRRA